MQRLAAREPALTLLADDEPQLLRALGRSCLNRADWRVVIAASADEALARCRAGRIDAVLARADRWGTEALGRLRSEPRLAGTPVLLLAPEPDDLAPAGASSAVLRWPATGEAVAAALAALVGLPRRGASRRRAALRVEWSAAAGQGIATTKDVGAEGFFLRGHVPFRAGEAVRVSFELPDEGRPLVRADGEVVRLEAGGRDSHLVAGAALRFVGLGVRERELLARFVGAPVEGADA